MFIEEFILTRNIEIEQMVLCRIITTGKVHPDLIPEYFCSNERILFDAILEQWNQFFKIDIQILKNKFIGTIEECLSRSGTDTAAAIEILHENWCKREIGKMINEIPMRNEATKILEHIQTQTGRIATKRTGGEYNHASEISSVLEAQERAQMQNKKTAGFETGIQEIDKLISGFERGKFYVIGALKKTAKSRLGVYLSVKAISQGAGVFWDSLEMSRKQLNTLLCSYFTEIDSSKFGKQMEPGDYQKIALMAGVVNDHNWSIYREKTITALKSRILFERAKKRVDLVFVDYLQRAQAITFKKNRSSEVEEIATGLADLSRELDVGIISFSQLSGEAEKLPKGEMPNMSHLKESQAIAESADCVLTLHNPNRHENPYALDGSYKLAEIYCLIEQRYDVSGCSFRFLGDLRTCHFMNHADPYGKN